MYFSDVPTICHLPQEALENVFEYLSTYREVEALRPICKLFNESAASIQREALHKLRFRTYKVIAKFRAGDWHKTTHTTDEALLSYNKRLARGSGSLMILSSIVQTADSLSIHMIRAGLLPPLPGAVLDEVKLAVKLASKRNPLVGKSRLKQIYKDVLAYFLNNRVGLTNHLPVLVMYRTVVDLLKCLPTAKCEKFIQNEGVLTYIRTLQPTQVTMQTRGEEVPSDADLLLGSLLQLGIHAASKYVMTEQAHSVTSEGFGDLKHCVRAVHLTLRPLQEDYEDLRHVGTLEDLRNANPAGFSVIIDSFTTAENEGELLGIRIEELSSSYTFGSM